MQNCTLRLFPSRNYSKNRHSVFDAKQIGKQEKEEKYIYSLPFIHSGFISKYYY